MAKKSEPSKDPRPTGALDPANLEDPRLFLNRELNRLQFIKFVLTEAVEDYHPLLERVKFLSIFCANLDELFMVRVSGLLKQIREDDDKRSTDGATPQEQMDAIRRELVPEVDRQSDCWNTILRPQLKKAGINVLSYDELDPKRKAVLEQYFLKNILPALTPLAFDPAHPFPHISNLSMNLAVVVKHPKNGERFARIKIPKMPDLLPRLIKVPKEEEFEKFLKMNFKEMASTDFVFSEDLVAHNLDKLFPGMEGISAHAFRVTRDAEFDLEDTENLDLLSIIEKSLDKRKYGHVTRLDVDKGMPASVQQMLATNLDIAATSVYAQSCPLGLIDLMELMKVNRPDLKDKPFEYAIPQFLQSGEDIFSVLRRRDILLYHPYDSFEPVVDFFRQAARDPNVLAIKMTLYRIEKDPPVLQALMEARENGKQVTVLIELKARFDEESNISWTRTLEKAGIHVVYGVMGLKTHAKMAMVVRKESDGLRAYVHLSSGNYNSVTAKIYADISYLTADPDIGSDVTALFNTLTGYATKQDYKKLLVSPGTIRDKILYRIDREIEHHKKSGNGYLAFKLNNLMDKSIIQALYRASQAGVKIDLQVRGIIALRPGLKGFSETITETTIVGRFLEHSRMYYFYNNGAEEILIGSSDLMPRNLYRRVEVLFPVGDPKLRDLLRDQILKVHLSDNVKTRKLLPDGTYERVVAKSGAPKVDSQVWMIENRGKWHG